eukprot:jgi/Ulvmu1/5588/UM023_0125.1
MSGLQGLLLCVCSDTLHSLDFCVAQIGSLEVDCAHTQLWPYIVNSWRRQIGESEKKLLDDEDAQVAIAECRKRTRRPLCVLIDPIDSHVNAEWVSAVLEFWRRCSVPFTVILVSLVPWLSVFGNSCPPEPRPHPVHFRKYSQEEIEVILKKQKPELVPEQLYFLILRSFVRPQYHASALLTDAQTLVADLIEEAMQADTPLTDTDAVMAHLQSARKRIAAGGFYEDFPGLSADVCTSACGPFTPPSAATSCDQFLELPRLTKLLVLAAHVASNNKPSADSKLFSTAPSQKRRRDAMASDRHAMAAQKQMESEGQVGLSRTQAPVTSHSHSVSNCPGQSFLLTSQHVPGKHGICLLASSSICLQTFGTERWIQLFYKIVESEPGPNVDLPQPTPSIIRDMQSVTLWNQMKQLATTRLLNQVWKPDRLFMLTFSMQS